MPKGEKRAGGRPKKSRIYSEAVKRNWQVAAKKIKAETGMTVEEYLLRLLISPDTQDAVKVGIAKLYNEALLVRESEQTINDGRTAPMIGLPERKRPPAELGTMTASFEPYAHKVH